MFTVGKRAMYILFQYEYIYSFIEEGVYSKAMDILFQYEYIHSHKYTAKYILLFNSSLYIAR